MECPHRIMERPLEHMSEEVFQSLERLITFYEEQEPLTTMILHKDGEPLLCPTFDDYFARIAERTPAKIDLYTNGYLLKPERVQSMSDNAKRNKIWILVSFHNFKHDGTRYDLTKVEENLRACLDLDVPNIEFIISMHKLDLTDEQWTHDFYVKWTNISIQKSQLKAVHVNTCINHWAGRVKQEQEMAHYVACPYMDASHMFIGVTGNIMPCCMDMDEEIVFGNILDDDRIGIMERRTEFYKKHEAREAPHTLCSKCLE
jgi:radical SAM protein with 4Fe4S-binding SPASM domain